MKVEDKTLMKDFLHRELKKLIETAPVIHHLESNGESILLFMDNLELANTREYHQMAVFA